MRPGGRERKVGREKLHSKPRLSRRQLAGNALTSGAGRFRERLKNHCLSENSGFHTGDYDLQGDDKIYQQVMISILSE